MKNVQEIIDSLEKSPSKEDLWLEINKIISNLGFSCTTYIDTRNIKIIEEKTPFYQTSVPDDFRNAYISMGFLGYDPVVTRAASSNAPFTWADCHEFGLQGRHRTGPKGRARQVMDLAMDYGYTQGFVIPLHAVDLGGQPASALLSLYWKHEANDMKHATPFWLKLAAATYHEKLLELRGLPNAALTAPPRLTDREREVLVWGCRGKTRSETADILNIAERTVEYHFENAMRKLGVHNKFHAIAVAVQSRLIAP